VENFSRPIPGHFFRAVREIGRELAVRPGLAAWRGLRFVSGVQYRLEPVDKFKFFNILIDRNQ
jgi:hypothetical protein